MLTQSRHDAARRSLTRHSPAIVPPSPRAGGAASMPFPGKVIWLAVNQYFLLVDCCKCTLIGGRWCGGHSCHKGCTERERQQCEVGGRSPGDMKGEALKLGHLHERRDRSNLANAEAHHQGPRAEGEAGQGRRRGKGGRALTRWCGDSLAVGSRQLTACKRVQWQHPMTGWVAKGSQRAPRPGVLCLPVWVEEPQA